MTLQEIRQALLELDARLRLQRRKARDRCEKRAWTEEIEAATSLLGLIELAITDPERTTL